MPAPCPAAQLDSQDRVQIAANVVNPSQRHIIGLGHFGGYTMREIAEERGKSLGAVRHHFYRGLKMMRLCLETQA